MNFVPENYDIKRGRVKEALNVPLDKHAIFCISQWATLHAQNAARQQAPFHPLFNICHAALANAYEYISRTNKRRDSLLDCPGSWNAILKEGYSHFIAQEARSGMERLMQGSWDAVLQEHTLLVDTEVLSYIQPRVELRNIQVEFQRQQRLAAESVPKPQFTAWPVSTSGPGSGSNKSTSTSTQTK